MIVRIATEGQYRIDSAYLDKLNAVDEDLVNAVAEGDEERFQALFQDLLSLVREHGTPVPPEELVESLIVLPPPDTTLQEAAEMFTGDGVIPG